MVTDEAIEVLSQYGLSLERALPKAKSSCSFSKVYEAIYKDKIIAYIQAKSRNEFKFIGLFHYPSKYHGTQRADDIEGVVEKLSNVIEMNFDEKILKKEVTIDQLSLF